MEVTARGPGLRRRFKGDGDGLLVEDRSIADIRELTLLSLGLRLLGSELEGTYLNWWSVSLNAVVDGGASRFVSA